jgi:hypothetical protein
MQVSFVNEAPALFGKQDWGWFLDIKFSPVKSFGMTLKGDSDKVEVTPNLGFFVISMSFEIDCNELEYNIWMELVLTKNSLKKL